jgi:Ca2+-binding EF-hand superfamily protein
MLDRADTKLFVKDILKSVDRGFNQSEFSRTFREIDVDGNGLISQKEMINYLTEIWQNSG